MLFWLATLGSLLDRRSSAATASAPAALMQHVYLAVLAGRVLQLLPVETQCRLLAAVECRGCREAGRQKW